MLDSCTDHDTELSRLWGAATLKRLYVSRGVIKDQNINKMAHKMSVLKVYNQNYSKVDVEMTFKTMLEEWFEEKLFDFPPSDARRELVRVLRECMSSRRVVTTIERVIQRSLSVRSVSNLSLSHFLICLKININGEM